MCNPCHDSKREHGAAVHGRREVLMAGAALVTAPLLAGVVTGTPATQTGVPVGNGPFSARAYGTTSATSPLGPLQIQRHAVGPNDVLLDVLYCGVCHSDIHVARSEWGPSRYPCVPGHEIIGRVQAVGSAVTKFKVGNTLTYDSPDRVHGGYTLGGYAEKIVVSERFVIRIPPGADLPATTPLLCVAITTFSPMQHWKLEAGQHVGVIGLGGLGHMAVKLAVARRADVTVFTTSPGKIADAQRLGARGWAVAPSQEPCGLDHWWHRRNPGSHRLLRSAEHQGGHRADPCRGHQPGLRAGRGQRRALSLRHRHGLA